MNEVTIFQEASLGKLKKIHFIGIGGIGVSAVARMLILEGKKVSGSDASMSEVTDELKKLGAEIFLGHSARNIPKDVDFVIYTRAISFDNPEFFKAKKLGVPVISYPESLSLISKNKFTIAVSGTHGKTTTTAMIAEVLIDAGLDPTVIVGSMLKREKSNFVAGKSNYLVVEADEYQRSFLQLSPKILVITNIANDHLDYYKDLSDIQAAFSDLAAKVPSSGYIIARTTDAAVKPALLQTKAKLVSYQDFLYKKIRLPIPGTHNRENAACALAVAHILGISKLRAESALTKFSGTWRRFDHKGETPTGTLVYDDYAHNPDKVRAAIAGYREAHPGKRLIVVFQPHLYSRTKTLLGEFARSFSGIDELFVVPIFAAREQPDPEISSVILAEQIQIHSKIPVCAYTIRTIEPRLKKVSGDAVIITMGAGDIYKLADRLVKKSNGK